MNASACRIPGRGGGVAPGVSPAGSASTRTRPPEEMTNPHCDHPGHTSRYALFSPFLTRCQYLYRCVISVNLAGVHYITVQGHHSPVSLTGSTRQPSWRVRPGSVRHHGGQRFHSDDTVADVRSIFPLTRGQVIRGPRYHALSGGTAPVLQQYSHILYRLFTRSVRITFRALLTSSSCSALTSPDNPAHRHTPGNSFLLAPGGVFHGEGVPVTDDDGATVATGGEPEDRLPAHCNDRCPVHVVSAGASASSTSRRSFSERVPNSIRRSFSI